MLGTGRVASRNDVIDAFRGVAILSVVAFHYLVRWAPPHSATNIYGYHQYFPALFSIGGYGVHLFFVISGLVITMTARRSGGPLEFGVLRFARLYPAFLVGMSLTMIVTSLADVQTFKTTLVDVPANLIMLAADLNRTYIDGAYWSLAVEIKFYFFVIIGIWLFRDDFWKPIAALAIVGCLIRFNWASESGHVDKALIAKFMPLFLLGMGGWFLIFEKRVYPGWVLLGLGLILYPMVAESYADQFANMWLVNAYILTLTALMFLLLWKMPGVRLWPLAWIGRISYSLYLIHQFVGVIMIRWFVAHGFPDIDAALFTTCVCTGIAAAMFYAVEVPGKMLIMNTFAWARENFRPKSSEASNDQRRFWRRQ